MFSPEIKNMGKIIACGTLVNIGEHDTKNGSRLSGEIETGEGERIPFSTGNGEIQKTLITLENKRTKLRGFARFGRNELGNATISVAAWGPGERPGVEPWTDKQQQPGCQFVGTGVLAEITKDDDGNITSAVLDASTTYEDRISESHIPLTFTPDAASAAADQGIQDKDQITVFASLRFASEYDERWEVERTVQCEVLVEEVNLLRKSVGTGTGSYLL